MTDKQLARLNETTALSKVEDFNAWYDQMKDAAFIVSPLTHLDSIPSIYQISRRIVKLDPNPQGTDVYKSGLFHKGDEVSPTKVGLLKIMTAAGASMKSSTRTDGGEGAHPYIVTFHVVIKARDFDGMWREFGATKQIDLRDKSPDSAGMSDKELAQARKNIVPLCETKALERAIRGFFSLPHKYTQKDLASKPFICPVLVLNAENPAVQVEMIRSHLTGGSPDRLYGESRELKQVEGARVDTPKAIEQPKTPPTPAPPAEDLGEDLPEVPDDQGPTIIVCGCPCGHGSDISEETAAATMERYGAARCPKCTPTATWDAKLHEATKKLNLPKRADLTAEKVTAMLAAAKK